MECRLLGLHARDRIDQKFEVQGSKFRKPQTSDFGPRTLAFPACLARVISLCVAAAFSLVVFVDKLLEFIEFGWSYALK